MPVLENARHEKFVQCLISGMSQRLSYRESFPKAKSCKLRGKSSVCSISGSSYSHLKTWESDFLVFYLVSTTFGNGHKKNPWNTKGLKVILFLLERTLLCSYY